MMHSLSGHAMDDIEREDNIVAQATEILRRRMLRHGSVTDPTAMKNHLVMLLGSLQNEIFHALWLDGHNRIIASETLFHGTIDGAEVHPRVVLQRALFHNARGLICAHNHPSGIAEPSAADRAITRRLADALAMFEVRLLDHIVVAGTTTVSFAERGWV